MVLGQKDKLWDEVLVERRMKLLLWECRDLHVMGRSNCTRRLLKPPQELHRPIQLTQCCTQFRSLGVKILCVFRLHDNVAFKSKWSTWNKTFYFSFAYKGTVERPSRIRDYSITSSNWKLGECVQVGVIGEGGGGGLGAYVAWFRLEKQQWFGPYWRKVKRFIVIYVICV